jgi:hypothetical protein
VSDLMSSPHPVFLCEIRMALRNFDPNWDDKTLILRWCEFFPLGFQDISKCEDPLKELLYFQRFVITIYCLSILFIFVSDFLFLSCDFGAFPQVSPRGKIRQYDLGSATWRERKTETLANRSCLVYPSGRTTKWSS